MSFFVFSNFATQIDPGIYDFLGDFWKNDVNEVGRDGRRMTGEQKVVSSHTKMGLSYDWRAKSRF